MYKEKTNMKQTKIIKLRYLIRKIVFVKEQCSLRNTYIKRGIKQSINEAIFHVSKPAQPES